MYKSFDKLVCTGTITITYIQRHNTRYVKIYKDEFYSDDIHVKKYDRQIQNFMHTNMKSQFV